jgi:CRISPR/Cas system-associated exonuclease Cas4 (RecB family)
LEQLKSFAEKLSGLNDHHLISSIANIALDSDKLDELIRVLIEINELHEEDLRTILAEELYEEFLFLKQFFG